ncbi:MAG: flagellar basal-body rod protein FlgF [Alphaproteobacteria bacterium]|nr:flagellar basal-body rod protein FlgF [Alphaproteobacteria bacterium]
MENAPLIGLSRQIALRRQLDVVANNLANINTFGFKAEKMLFEDHVQPLASAETFPLSDRALHYTADWATLHDFKPGPIVQTGGTYDMALEGPGFLTVQTANGPAYSRNGALHLDAGGTLVTADGDPVLGEGGPIVFAPSETDIRFGSDGSILSSAGSKGRLALVEFADPQSLAHLGNSLYAASDADPGQAAVETRVHHGMLEHSNVSGVAETAEMIRINRTYEMVAQFVQRQDDLRRTAIRKLGELV